jgi:hypothetical protein
MMTDPDIPTDRRATAADPASDPGAIAESQTADAAGTRDTAGAAEPGERAGADPRDDSTDALPATAEQRPGTTR